MNREVSEARSTSSSRANSARSGVVNKVGASSRPASGARALEKVSSLKLPSTSGHAIPSDQLDLLKLKHAQQEAENRSGQDAAQWAIQENRTTLSTFKAENRELKAEVARRGGVAGGRVGSARDAGKQAAERAIEKMEKEVHDLRRQYDKIMQEKKTVVSKLENLQDQMKDLNKSTEAVMQPAAREMRQLQNRLDKAQVKCNEAQSIRRTYEQVLEKMLKEQTTFDASARGLEDALKAKGQEHDVLLRASVEAQATREQAKQELAAFEEHAAKQRAQREKALAAQRQTANSLQHTNQALLHRQLAGLSPTLPPLNMQSPPSSSNQAQGGTIHEGQGSARGGASTAALQPFVGTLPEAVEVLCHSAAVTSSSALLDKMLSQQDTFENLTSMRRAANLQASGLEAAVQAAQHELADLRSGGHMSTQAQMDKVQAELQRALASADTAKEAHEQVLKVYVDMRSGLEHLSSMVSVLPLPQPAPPVPLTDDTLGDVIAQCQQRLIAAHKFIQTLPKAAKLLDDMVANPDFAFATNSTLGQVESSSSVELTTA